MKHLGLRDPFFQSVRRVLHGQNHGRDLSVKSSGELSDGREFVFELSFGGEVFEVVNKLLESIVWSSVFILSWFLDELGQVSSSSHFGVEGIKVFVIVFDELCEGLVLGFERSVFQLIVPFLGEGYAFSRAHLAKDEGEFELIGGINGGIDQEVGVHGF